jgi:hypothetical protein
VILPVDIDRLKKLKWRPINLVSIEIWNSIQLLHFIEYIKQYLCYVVAVSYIVASVLFVDETGVPRENPQPVVSH